ncbi:MAG: hypothetical protein HN867_16800 [Deltaproteobacteria bacterium]|nr:hypothetical protein [Deltaproteobacteria bacterium]MBT7205124.1 hypothetical protein [Deltaproteobacteria bacterium]
MTMVNGKPVAELRPYSGGRIDSPFGLHPLLSIHGDVIEPLEDHLWKAPEWFLTPTLCYG